MVRRLFSIQESQTLKSISYLRISYLNVTRCFLTKQRYSYEILIHTHAILPFLTLSLKEVQKFIKIYTLVTFKYRDTTTFQFIMRGKNLIRVTSHFTDLELSLLLRDAQVIFIIIRYKIFKHTR